MTLQSIMATLTRNERMSIEEGGLPVSGYAREALRKQVRLALRREPRPTKIVPFSASGGGAYLIVEMPDQWRLTLNIDAMGGHTAVWIAPYE